MTSHKRVALGIATLALACGGHSSLNLAPNSSDSGVSSSGSSSSGSSSSGSSSSGSSSSGSSSSGSSSTESDGGAVDSGAGKQCSLPLPSFGDVLVERTDYAGTSIGSCPEGYPDGAFQVVGSDWTEPQTRSENVVSTVAAKALDAKLNGCTVKLAITLRDDKVAFDVGQAIDIRVRRTFGDQDSAGKYTWVLKNSNGVLIFAFTRDAAANNFDTDLIGLDLTNIVPTCTLEDGSQLLRARLSTVDSSCDVQSLTRRCCSFWNKPFEVRDDFSSQAATGTAARTTLLVASAGLLKTVRKDVPAKALCN